MRASLSTRYGIILSVMTAVIGCAVLLINLFHLNHFFYQSVTGGQQKLYEVVERQLKRDTLLLASTLANSLDVAVYNSDFSAMHEQLKTLSERGRIGYVFIYNASGEIVYDGTETVPLYGKPISQYLMKPLTATMIPEWRKIDSEIHIAQPILSTGEPFAALRFSINYVEAEADRHQLSTALVRDEIELRNSVIISSLLAIGVLLLVTTAIVFLLSQRMLQPIRQLSEQCRRYALGETDINFELKSDDEFGVLGRSLNDMTHRLEIKNAEIERLAYQDTLTRLPNRRMFNDQLEHLIHWAEHHQRHLALLFIDLDHFKQVNDTAGHRVGDELLAQAAERLTNLLIELADQIDFPIPENQLLSRLGGDEFVLLLPNAETTQAVAAVAHQVEQRLNQHFLIEKHRFHISASIGITLYPEDGRTVDELLMHADIAMYAAKHSGRNRYRFFETDMNHQMLEKIAVLQGIRDALANDDLFLYYQPIFDLQSQQVIGAEALLRWRHPEKGIIAPEHFIAELEKSELIIPVTLWVLKQACSDLKEFILLKNSQFKLSVNMSGSILNETSIVGAVRRMLNQYEIAAHILHVEITETGMMENIDHCTETLLEWKDAGADIWIDDFGTGYSSLSYLHTLPIDGLKIDRSFVMGLNSETPHKVVEAILALAASLGLKTVSEGIETLSQKSTLCHMGSTYGQGFLMAVPMPLNSLLNLLEEPHPDE